jgi:two-component system, chemotaxis family, chemotaxis protein CheY
MPASAGILIVDDPAAASYVVRALLELGFTDIEQVADAQSALKRLHERTFVLVISEWRLAAMSGLELLRRVRQNTALKDVRFLLLSASIHPQLAGTAHKLGTDGFLTRPFAVAELKAALDQALSARSP